MYREAPHYYVPGPYTDQRSKIFLAGGIQGCPDWQREVLQELHDADAIVFNPRRKVFPDVAAASEASCRVQICWEFTHIAESDIILMWFPEESVCPITLYELGRITALYSDTKKLIIGTHPSYPRRVDVKVQTELATDGKVSVLHSLHEMIAAVIAALR